MRPKGHHSPSIICHCFFWLTPNLFFGEKNWLKHSISPCLTHLGIVDSDDDSDDALQRKEQKPTKYNFKINTNLKSADYSDGDDKNDDVVDNDDDGNDDVLGRKEERPKKYNFVTQHKSPMSVDRTFHEVSEYVRL